RKAGVPIVPMHFAGANSAMFHLAGKVHPMLRTVQLPNELFTKRNKNIVIKIGKPIAVKDIEDDDVEQLGRFLRAKTYAIGTDVNVKKFFRPNLQPAKKPEPIADAVEVNLLNDELLRLPSDSLVLEQGDFQVYVGSSKQLPHCLNEIGRLREVTFREVGEGSNLSIDVDEFDLYYLHMFIWDKKQHRIAGAYRIGQGDKIFPELGKKGFYTESLFKFKKQFYPILGKTVELGRSFITKEYQTKPMPLFILWRGILHFLIQNPQYRYIIGPVTISNEYSGLSKWLIIEFIKRHFYDKKLASWVTPRTAFEVQRKDRDEKLLDAINFDDIQKLDNLISDIEPRGFRVPVLLKKYLKQNARIIAFNIDPKFNNALDGLMILDMQDLPQGTIDKLKMEMKEQSSAINNGGNSEASKD
ncbi:MAG: lysophospholipid acyltransferase family protein, partial [Bacteroidetes bacterium]|nr:lysophospholipid acyltransferase family protein [Bacteroidota bacterium]